MAPVARLAAIARRARRGHLASAFGATLHRHFWTAASVCSSVLPAASTRPYGAPKRHLPARLDNKHRIDRVVAHRPTHRISSRSSGRIGRPAASADLRLRWWAAAHLRCAAARSCLAERVGRPTCTRHPFDSVPHVSGRQQQHDFRVGFEPFRHQPNARVRGNAVLPCPREKNVDIKRLRFLLRLQLGQQHAADVFARRQSSLGGSASMR